MSKRSYKDAVEHLNSLQSNAAALEAARASGSSRLSEFAIPEMLEYLGRIGYTPKELNALNVIHITGTKGKGSTSAFTDSILRHALPNATIGLYTSPHLVAVRERIRINGTPISEDQFVTLLAFHVFLSLKVDATVLEVGVGGAYDSTNIVPNPIVTGITALGIDHVAVLGRTLEDIAWQKGGIFKEGVPAITVDQPPEGLRVLEERAKELKASSFTVIPLETGLSNVELGLAGAHQAQNASLAIALAQSFLGLPIPAEGGLPKNFITALQKTKWPGRCQTVVDPNRQNVTWYLDGAHTVESLKCCIQWFASPTVGLSQGEPNTIQSGITTQFKLHKLNDDENTFFDHVIFCTNVTYADGKFKGDLTTVAIAEDELAQLKTQHELASAWSSLYPNFPMSRIHVLPSIEHAVKEIETHQSFKSIKVLVAGSLHLVGGVIEATGLSNAAL
ncbi:hypothetical protein C0992_007777 [Termitomyces sp. T32_za158]|nr:hypothetical protein C0992_007777 [Termitomyces sp. T32_za158]